MISFIIGADGAKISGSSNEAVTDLSVVMSMVHWSPLRVSHPLHPSNEEPLPAVAVSVTTVPGSYTSLQSAGQLIPVPATEPLPDTATVRTSFGSNVAVAVRLAFIVTLHVVLVPLQAPVGLL